jgi:adenylate cyclase
MNQPELLKLGGSLQTGSVLFVDIQGFTSLSEKMPPQAVVELLNRYLGDLSEIAIDENGLVDKFIGDAMMVVWGAPLADPQHANHACQAALKMQEYLASARETDDRAENLYARIGIYSGEFVAGNVGGQRKFDYTVIGDTVNVAARLESANNELGTHILIGDATHNALDQDKFTCRRLDSIKIKGRLEQVVVYELESAKEPANV